MKIIEVLANSKTEDSKKMKAVVEMVSTIRAKYGNEDVEFDAPKVNSTEGTVAINLLTEKEKVAVATKEIKSAIAEATAKTECTHGVVFDRAFEAIIATNAILANLELKSDSAY